MRITFVIVTGYACQAAKLGRTEHSVRHRDAQHRGKTLYIQSVLKSQWKKLVFAQLASQCSLGLVTELCNALGSHLPVVFVINIHSGTSC